MNNFGYAVGVALTDGSVFIHRQSGPTYRKKDRSVRLNADGSKILGTYTSYRIELKCKDKAFIDRFADALESLAGKPVRRIPMTSVNRSANLPGLVTGRVFHGFRLCVIHKETAIKLMETRDQVRALQLDGFSDDALRAMLVAFVDADGYVSLRDGNILIRQKDPSFMVAVLKRLEIPYRLSFYEGQTASEIYIQKAVARTIDTYKHQGPALAVA